MRISIGSTLALAFSLAGCVSSEGVSEGTTTTRQQANAVRPKINIIGNNGGDGFPLGLCQGDCDKDEDCAGHLICHERKANESVPGCRGGRADGSEADYCVAPPSDVETGDGNTEQQEEEHHDEEEDHENEQSDTEATTPSGPFFLELYWRDGFDWAEDTWCMKCDKGRCRENKEMYIESCQRVSSFFARGPTKLEFLDFGDSVQVRIAAPSFSLYRLCLQRTNQREVRVAKCDDANPLQRWVSPRGRTDGSRFELAPLSDNSLCMTQRHHPKRRERVKLEPCETARIDHTALWSRYYP